MKIIQNAAYLFLSHRWILHNNNIFHFKHSMCGAIERSGALLVEINMSDNAFGPIGKLFACKRQECAFCEITHA